MDTRVLKYLLAVAKDQSSSVAAERLFLSQPTLSRQIKQLKDELGTQLRIRSCSSFVWKRIAAVLSKVTEK